MNLLIPYSYTSSFLVAVAMIGPFISAVALILIIPIGFVTDYIMGHWRPAEESSAVLTYQIVGCTLIVVGFALLQWASKVRRSFVFFLILLIIILSYELAMSRWHDGDSCRCRRNCCSFCLFFGWVLICFCCGDLVFSFSFLVLVLVLFCFRFRFRVVLKVLV